MLGIIRVLTTEKQEILEEHGKRIEGLYPVKTVSRCIADQPNGIFSEETEKMAIPKIVALAQKMRAELGVGAITISCAADPALDETRAVLDVPVLGAGVSGAHAAAMVGNKVGIMGITEEAPVRLKEELGDRFFKYSYSPKHRKTTDLFEEGAKEELQRVAAHMIDAGADVILFACTGFSTIRLKEFLLPNIQVPVIDLVEAQAIAYQLIGGEQLDKNI